MTSGTSSDTSQTRTNLTDEEVEAVLKRAFIKPELIAPEQRRETAESILKALGRLP